MTPTRLAAWLAGLFGIISLWLLLRQGDTDVIHDPTGAIFLVGLSLWTLLPYALLVAVARFGKFRTVAWGAPAVLVIVGLYGNLAYADVNFHFWAKSDAQEALVFLVMPFAQNIIATGLMTILLGIGALAGTSERKRRGSLRALIVCRPLPTTASSESMGSDRF
jgi:hypothetical protein